MEFRIAVTFTASLTTDEQKLVKQSTFDVQVNIGKPQPQIPQTGKGWDN